MNDKKNIDRLFQEKFKDFEVAPNDQVWPNIESALHPKKKRRIIPFWWQVGGVAAGLIIGFFALNSLLNTDVAVDENSVVIEEVGKPAVSPSENDNSDANSDPSDALQKDIAPKAIENEQLVNSGTPGNSSGTSEDDIKKSTNSGSSSKNNAVANASQTPQKTNSPAGKNQLENKRLNAEEGMVNQQAREKEKNTANPSVVTNVPKNSNQGIAVDNKKNTKDDATNIQNPNTIGTPKDPASGVATNRPNSNQEKIASNNTISPDGILDDKKDSTAVATVEEPNALEELLQKNEKEEKTVAEAKVNRWQVTPNVAPIYFSSTSNGSPIHEQFATNSKSFENNLSYGLGLNYAITNKISLRTGINTFTLGYNTNDVVMFAALDQPAFSNVASSATGSTIQVVSRTSASAMSPFDNNIQNSSNAVMTQRMGYFEVPLEMSYKLVDKKFGINVIGGFSTLFLNQNEVSVASESMSASLGRAKNLNDIHFSTNVGFGFKYRFWKSFEANFEPMFKYQINTFNRDAGNFKPYFVGLYSGVSFNF